jgi:O-antigen/teichoic acid export membrane protein
MSDKARSPRALWRTVVRSPTLLTSATGIAVYGLSAITGPLLSRFLGPAGRGDLTAVLLPSEMLGFLILFGLPNAAVFFADRYSHRDMVAASWAFGALFGGVLTAAVWFFVPTYLHEHDPTTVTWLRLFFLVHIGFVPVMTTIHLFRLRPNFVAFNVLRSLQLVIETALLVGFALANHLTLTTALWAALISYGVWYVVVLVYGRGWPSSQVKWSVVREMVNYGSRLSVGGLASLAISRLDQLLLVGIVNSSDLGAYAVAATASGVSSAVAYGVGTVLFRHLREAEDPEAARLALRHGVRNVLLMSSGVAALVAVCSPIAIPLLFGAEFSNAVAPLLVLLPGQVLADLGFVVGQRMLVDNRPGVTSHALLAAAGTTVVLLIVLIKPFGIMGAAFATTLSQGVFAVYMLVVAGRHHRDVVAGRRSSYATDADLTLPF